jgi:hypothetical protein
MRKKIPCKVVKSVPLAAHSEIICQGSALIACGEQCFLGKYTAAPGAILYSSNLNITNISDNDGRRTAIFDAYF